jgi:hypothetical protein
MTAIADEFEFVESLILQQLGLQILSYFPVSGRKRKIPAIGAWVA